MKRENARASGETRAISKVLLFIAGKENKHYRLEADLPFNNLEPFDKDISEPKPDVYYEAPPSTIHPRVRANLGPHIIPSTTTSRQATYLDLLLDKEFEPVCETSGTAEGRNSKGNPEKNPWKKAPTSKTALSRPKAVSLNMTFASS